MKTYEQQIKESETMSEMTKIFEHWYMIETISEKCVERKMWLEMEKYIFEHCDDENIAEDICQYYHQFTKDLVKNAFINGYKKAFQLYLEIFHENIQT